MSQRKVATSTSISSAAPWVGRSRSRTACENPSPIHATPSAVKAIEVVISSWERRSAAKTNTIGKKAAKTSRIWKESPKCAASTIAATAAYPGRTIGRIVAAIRKNSRRPRTPSATIASAKTSPPIPTIAIAKMIQGIATTTRAVVSDISGTIRCSRERSGGAGSARISSSGSSKSSRSSGSGRKLDSRCRLALLPLSAELERRRVEILGHCRAPKRRWRSSYSRRDSAKASRPKSGQSSSRKTNSE